MDPPVARDAELLELDVQNRATWQTLEAATRQRDAAVRFHGGFVALFPLLLGVLTVGQLLGAVVAGLAFLLFVSANTLDAVQSLRLLQFQLGTAEACSRRRLHQGGPEPYFGRPPTGQVPTLADQRDPMGFVVASARLLVISDVLALVGLAVVAGAYAVGATEAMKVGVPVAGAAAVGVAVATRAVVDRSLRAGERAVAADIRARLAVIGLA